MCSTRSSAPADVAPDVPAAPAFTAKDEALCSYLLTLEEGDREHLGIPPPDDCKPYLRAIGHPDEPKPDPYRLVLSLEDLVEMIHMRREYEAVFPPAFGQ